MKDAFCEFSWTVAPGYEWQHWVDGDGRPTTAPVRLLDQLEEDVSKSRARFGRGGVNPSRKGANVARAYIRAEEDLARMARMTGPVLARLNAELSVSYEPMDRKHSALFRLFAALDCRDLASILKFASVYGDLGLVHERQSVSFRDRDGHLHRHSVTGESHLAWAIEICHMREALQLSELNSFDALRRLRWLAQRHLPNVRAELGFDKTGRARLFVRPLSLISVLWLQFALGITGDKRFVECKFCRRVFEISTDQTGFRSHREFCSGSCKTMDFRKRRTTAMALANAGERLADIAEKTATDVATVRRWLASLKRRGNRATGEV